MSIANLAGGNGEGIVIPIITSDHIFVNQISTKNTGLVEIDSPIATNSINNILGSPDLTIGNPANNLIIASGNTAIATNTVISSSSIDLPNQITFGGGGSYTINFSAAQQIINYNYSGARVQANAGLIAVRRIGDWVDVHIRQNSIDQATTTANTPLIISALPVNFRPVHELWMRGWMKINQPGGQSFLPPPGSNAGIRGADIVVKQDGTILIGADGVTGANTDGGTFSTTLGQTCGIQTLLFSFCIAVP